MHCRGRNCVDPAIRKVTQIFIHQGRAPGSRQGSGIKTGLRASPDMETHGKEMDAGVKGVAMMIKSAGPHSGEPADIETYFKFIYSHRFGKWRVFL